MNAPAVNGTGVCEPAITLRDVSGWEEATHEYISGLSHAETMTGEKRVVIQRLVHSLIRHDEDTVCVFEPSPEPFALGDERTLLPELNFG